jgi:elongation factor G
MNAAGNPPGDPSSFRAPAIDPMRRRIDDLRNIGIIAHIDAGKTTVTERMLFYTGSKHRVGEVDKGTTETDFYVEEQERGITIFAACVTFPWRDVLVNLIDTPGHVDFTAEVERSLRVLDGGVVVFSAREGVEAQSETVWRQADKYRVPRLAFINKLDREGADFEGTLRQISERLAANPVALQIPVGLGPAHTRNPFRGLVDLVSMKMLTFGPDADSKEVLEHPIPEDMVETARAWRETLLERLYDYSNELMELALAEQPVPEELIRRVLREATIQLQIQPVLCGSALHGMGVQPVLDAVAWYLPSPADLPAIEGVNPAKNNAVERRRPDPDEPFCGLVFKIVGDKHGDMAWVRVYSGQLKANTRLLNPGRNEKENVAQLWHIHASRREQVPEVDTGDIVGIIGLRHSVTGDTLCDTRNPILLESILFPETVISMAIEPESTADRKKLADTLEVMKRQDPTFRAVLSEETGQTIISGMGELHLEIIKNRLLRDFNLKVKVHKPRVSYRESIDRAVEVEGECHRVMAGQHLFGRLRVRMEPHEAAKGKVAVTTNCPPDALPAPLLQAALDELKALGEGGGTIGGFPLMKMKVSVRGGEAREEGSTEVAFRIAAADAFEKGLKLGGPVLLEPIMKLTITTPEDYLGDFVGDLQQRRAIIARTESRGNAAVIEAHAPLAELFGYSSAMRSLSQGRASCSMEPLHYAPAPAEIARSFAM